MTLNKALNSKRADLEQHQQALAFQWHACSGLHKVMGLSVITMTGLAALFATSRSAKALGLRATSLRSVYSAGRLLLRWAQAFSAGAKSSESMTNARRG